MVIRVCHQGKTKWKRNKASNRNPPYHSNIINYREGSLIPSSLQTNSRLMNKWPPHSKGCNSRIRISLMWMRLLKVIRACLHQIISVIMLVMKEKEKYKSRMVSKILMEILTKIWIRTFKKQIQEVLSRLSLQGGWDNQQLKRLRFRMFIMVLVLDSKKSVMPHSRHPLRRRKRRKRRRRQWLLRLPQMSQILDLEGLIITLKLLKISAWRRLLEKNSWKIKRRNWRR